MSGPRACCIVVGARPNFVKAAPLLAATKATPHLRPYLVHTGQHFDDAMSGALFRDLGLPEPDARLGCGSGSHAAQVAAIMARLEPVLVRERPVVVVVVGDVNSTLAAALTATKLGIPVAHVEAGLRCGDRRMPEEVNRTVVDHLADFCFTTEPSGRTHLLREGIPAARIYDVGNVMVDALHATAARWRASSVLARLGVTPRAYGVVTLHRAENVDAPVVLRRIVGACAEAARALPLVWPMHPRTAERLAALGEDVHGSIVCTPPLSYCDMIALEASAAYVLTDSGGVQEETTALGVPCITVREHTERPITVTVGTNCVVGTSPDAIRSAIARVRAGAWQRGSVPDGWDGRAAERILAVLARACVAQEIPA